MNLEQVLHTAGIDEVEKKIKLFETYKSALLEWNNKVNLTSITNENEFDEKHYIDSLACIQSAALRNAGTVIDVGTGGGFPGVPLAIAFPGKDFLLLDSSRKRLNIIQELCDDIGIDNVETIHARAEDAAQDERLRQFFDLCVSRAVATLNILCEYCLPFVKIGGSMIAYKGPETNDEIFASKTAIEILGGNEPEIIPYDDTCFATPSNAGHNLVVINKLSPTPDKYPRKGNKPRKYPL